MIIVMTSNDVTETNTTSGNRPSRVSITGRPSIVRPPGSNPLPGAARGFPVAVVSEMFVVLFLCQIVVVRLTLIIRLILC